ncbi:MAG: hypothetical protein IAG13_28355 [Deltaproteobacteria bacterium]|nr:hypothetical protein [Nannocystaceae bacterium]
MSARAAKLLACSSLLFACAGDGGGEPSSTSSGAADSSGESSGEATTGGATSSDTSSSDTSSGEASTTGEPSGTGIPRLPAGNHLGMIIGFNAELPPTTATAVDAAWTEALDRGMDIGRVQISWAELEPSPGEIDVAPLVEQLGALVDDDLAPMVLIETLDSDSLELPPDLLDPDNPNRLAPGLAFDDATVTGRFAALLDVAVPVMRDRGVFGLSVANEPGTLFERDPSGTDAVVGFLAAARSHVHGLDPELGVTMTMREVEVGTRFLDAVLAESDFATMNFYCALPDLTVDASAGTVRLAAMMTATGDLDVVLQELGCPAGPDEGASTIGATAELQAMFYADVGAALAVEPRLRAAFAFQLVDWSPETIALLEASVEDAPQWFIDRFVESLATMGMRRYADGTPRPAWSAWLEAQDGL